MPKQHCMNTNPSSLYFRHFQGRKNRAFTVVLSSSFMMMMLAIIMQRIPSGGASVSSSSRYSRRIIWSGSRSSSSSSWLSNAVATKYYCNPYTSSFSSLAFCSDAACPTASTRTRRRYSSSSSTTSLSSLVASGPRSAAAALTSVVSWHQNVRPLQTTTTTMLMSSSSSKPTTRTKSKIKETLYRADRVLSNRCPGRTRSECFTLLKQRRVQIQQQPDTAAAADADADASHDDDHHDQMRPSWTTIAGPSIKIPMNAMLRILPLYNNVNKQGNKNNKKSSGKQDGDDNDIATSTRTTSSGMEVVPPVAPLLAVYYKPKWVLSVRSDPQLQRPCLNAATLPANSPLLPDTSSGSMMHPVGRLDYDSSGLLLFSSSGTLTQRILHPHFDLPKEYRVTVVGNVLQLPEPNNENDSVGEKKQSMISLREQLTRGVKTGEGVHVATLQEDTIVVEQDAQVVARYLQELRNNLPSEYNMTRLSEQGYLNDLDPTKTNCISIFSLVVTEGKHRMVRRMLANCGYPVLDLHRVRIGQIHLNTTNSSSNEQEEQDDEILLQPGEYRYLTPAEEAWVQNKVLASSVSSSTTSKAKKPTYRKTTPNKKKTTSTSSRSDHDATAKKKKKVNKKKSSIHLGSNRRFT